MNSSLFDHFKLKNNVFILSYYVIKSKHVRPIILYNQYSNNYHFQKAWNFLNSTIVVFSSYVAL